MQLHRDHSTDENEQELPQSVNELVRAIRFVQELEVVWSESDEPCARSTRIGFESLPDIHAEGLDGDPDGWRFDIVRDIDIGFGGVKVPEGRSNIIKGDVE